MRISIQFIALSSAWYALIDASSVHISLAGLEIDVSNLAETHGLKAPNQRAKPTPEYLSPTVLADYQFEADHGTHQGFLSKNDAYVKFSNIPYAFPPNISDARFAPPSSVEYREGVHEGKGTKKCPQAFPGWIETALEFLDEFSNSSSPLDRKWSKPIGPADYGKVVEAQGDEDCLYLDAYVPKKIWEERNKPSLFKPAVLVWIHGGGFVIGSKDEIGSPEGLFKAADNETEDNVIFISINYRLGMFGWMAGEKYQDAFGYENLGIMDQNAALNWVTRNIWQLGGDSRRITVMGQSAGGASIVHHLTYGGGYSSSKPAFQQAIIQSPGFFPNPNYTASDAVYKAVLKEANATDLDSLAGLDSKKLIQVNQAVVWNSTYGQFTFGPTVPNIVTPKLPGQLFKEHKFHEGVHVLLGYTGLDGLLFTPPWVRNGEGLRNHVRSIYSGTNDTTLSDISSRYPLVDPGNNGAQQRLTGLAVSDMFNDIAIKCNIHFVTEAINSLSNPSLVYRYTFNANPPAHGADLNYAFYPERPLPGLADANPTLAKRMQQNLVDFIRYRDPNPEGSEEWKLYRSDSRKVVKYGHMRSFIPYVKPDFEWKFEDDPMTERTRENCEFWRNAPYYSAGSSSRAGLVDQVHPGSLEL